MTRGQDPTADRLLEMTGNELHNLEAQLQATGLTSKQALALANGGLLGRWVEAGRQLLSGVEPVTTFVTTRCEWTAGDTDAVIRLAGGVCIRWINYLRYTGKVSVTWPDSSSVVTDLTRQWQRITLPSDPVQVEVRICDWNGHKESAFPSMHDHLRIREIHRIAAPEPLRVAIPLRDVTRRGGVQVQIGTASVNFEGTYLDQLTLLAMRWPLNATRYNIVLPANEVVSIARGVKAYLDTPDEVIYVIDSNQYADPTD